jgi:hypothetical protein
MKKTEKKGGLRGRPIQPAKKYRAPMKKGAY